MGRREGGREGRGEEVEGGLRKREEKREYNKKPTAQNNTHRNKKYSQGGTISGHER